MAWVGWAAWACEPQGERPSHAAMRAIGSSSPGTGSVLTFFSLWKIRCPLSGAACWPRPKTDCRLADNVEAGVR